MRSKVVGSAVAAAFALSVIMPGAMLAQDKPKVLVWTDAVRLPGFEAYRDSVADTVDVTVELARPGPAQDPAREPGGVRPS